MGKKEQAAPRVVIDTNVIISSLLFSGLPSGLVPLWQRGAVALLLSQEILYEYLRTLSYPKFHLSPKTVKALLERELLPFTEVVKVRSRVSLPVHPEDGKFLECALDGKAHAVISGDAHLLDLKQFKRVPVLTPRAFLEEFRLLS